MRDDKKLLQEIADVSLEHDGKRVKGTEGFEELRSERIRILAKNIDNFGSLSHLSPFQHIFDRMEDWREFFE